MTFKRILGFVVSAAVLLHLAQSSAYAYRVMRVLGADDGEVYTYVVRAKPTIAADIPMAPTATSVPAPSSGTPAQGKPVVQSAPLVLPDMLTAQGNNNNNGNGNGGGGGNLPLSTATPIPLCNGIQCSSTQTCYGNICREKCGINNYCAGEYRCESGACIPVRTDTFGNIIQAPTATPIVLYISPTSPVSKPNSPQANRPQSSPAAPQTQPDSPAAPQSGPEEPAPTRPVDNRTLYADASPQVPPPTPTIPPDKRGGPSTLVIEEPAPAPDPANPSAPAPTPVRTIIKGEELAKIEIKPPKEEPKTNTGAVETDEPSNLDITINTKTKGGFAIAQEEFVIVKGNRSVSIYANKSKKGTLALSQNNTKARIEMGLFIDPNTNILTVNTPWGPMKVSIMPDDALSIIRQLKVIEKNKPPQDIALITEEGQLQYEVKAEKTQKLFGMVPLSVPRNVYVSADTGSLMAIKQTPVWDFVTLFTF